MRSFLDWFWTRFTLFPCNLSVFASVFCSAQKVVTSLMSVQNTISFEAAFKNYVSLECRGRKDSVQGAKRSRQSGLDAGDATKEQHLRPSVGAANLLSPVPQTGRGCKPLTSLTVKDYSFAEVLDESDWPSSVGDRSIWLMVASSTLTVSWSTWPRLRCSYEFRTWPRSCSNRVQCVF